MCSGTSASKSAFSFEYVRHALWKHLWLCSVLCEQFGVKFHSKICKYWTVNKLESTVFESNVTNTNVALPPQPCHFSIYPCTIHTNDDATVIGDWVSVSVRCLKKPNKAQKYKFLKMKMKFPHRHVCSSWYNRELEISQKPNISQQRCSVVSFWEVIGCAGSGNVGRLTVKVKAYKPYSKYTPGWLVATNSSYKLWNTHCFLLNNYLITLKRFVDVLV